MSQLHSQEYLDLAQSLSEIGRFFAANKWSPATSSNYSARLSSATNVFALTRSGIDKYHMKPNDVILVNSDGEVIAPIGEKPSAETLIHCELYKDQSIGAVLHTHSIFATRLSLKHEKKEKIEISGYELLKGLTGNTTHLMTEVVPILPNHQDMQAFVKILRPVLNSTPRLHGFLMAGHGLYTWGKDLKEAKRHIETFEFLFESIAYQEMGF